LKFFCQIKAKILDEMECPEDEAAIGT